MHEHVHLQIAQPHIPTRYITSHHVAPPHYCALFFITIHTIVCNFNAVILNIEFRLHNSFIRCC